MSQTSPLYSLTPNVKTQISVTAQANRIRVVNDSSLYLRVYFGADAPLLATDPGWHDTISPGDKPLLWITGGTGQSWWAQTGNAASTPFTGVITFLPFFPVGALQASGGVVSGASILYITAFSPDENADRGGQTEAFVQAAKQARGQSLLGAVGVTSTIAFDQTTPFATHYLMDSLNPTGLSNLQKANQAGNSVVNLYLYGWGGTFRNNGPNVATLDVSPAFEITDSTGATVRQVQLPQVRRICRAVNFGCDSWFYPFVEPIVIQFSFLQNTLAIFDTLRYRYVFTSAQGVFDGYLYCLFLLDKVNQSPLLALSPGGGQSAAIATNQPWNATYNPQTY